MITLTMYDIIFIGGVALQATLISFMHDPRRKAIVYTFPIPFTLAMLALQRPVGLQQAVGLPFLFLFFMSVHFLHIRIRIPAAAAIAGVSILYCIVAGSIADILPHGSTAGFWSAFTVISILFTVLYAILPLPNEQGGRSGLNPLLKFILILMIITILVILKSKLQGFMSLFPVLGTISAYEARTCLKTMERQAIVVILCFLSLLATSFMLQRHIGVLPSVAVGWGPYFLTWFILGRYNKTRLEKLNEPQNTQKDTKKRV